jgi:hypothetical protein
MFKSNENVVFADVNLQEAPTCRGAPHNPGAGGWPTIKYFTPETGVTGGTYNKMTDLPMCQELLDRHRMMDYVEQYGNTVLCGVDGTNCTEKELTYLKKYQAEDADEQQIQLRRLEEITSKPMRGDLQEWAYRRMRILKKLLLASGSSDEL